MSSDRKKIALIIFSDPMIFPPTMNTASILAENGFEVDIIGVRHKSGDQYPTPKGARLIYLGELKRGIGLRLQFLSFCWSCVRLASINKYKWVFAYNMTGAVPGYLGSLASDARFLYHVHDTTIVKKKYGFYSLLKRMEFACARKADIVTFPQKERAELFSSEAKLETPPIVVCNGPRLYWGQDSIVDEEVAALKSRWGRVVLYQGGLNWKRGLQQVIESMPLWASKPALCLIGNIDLEPAFPNEAMNLATSLGVADRVLIRSTVPYLELGRVTKMCDVGLGVMATPEQNGNVNLRHLAGASNKMTEYMACGLPMIVPDNSEYKEFVEKPGLGVLVDAGSPISIAKGINDLLGEQEKYRKIVNRSKLLFKNVLNFDTQFSVVLKAVCEEEVEQN